MCPDLTRHTGCGRSTPTLRSRAKARWPGVAGYRDHISDDSLATRGDKVIRDEWKDILDAILEPAHPSASGAWLVQHSWLSPKFTRKGIDRETGEKM